MLVLDGDCGFCTWSANWIAARWPEVDGRAPAPPPVLPHTQPWQRIGADGLAALGLTVEQANAAAWWVDTDRRTWRGHKAVAKSLGASTRSMWRVLGAIILMPPFSWLSAGVYHLVTRYRHLLPGSTPACRAG